MPRASVYPYFFHLAVIHGTQSSLSTEWARLLAPFRKEAIGAEELNEIAALHVGEHLDGMSERLLAPVDLDNSLIKSRNFLCETVVLPLLMASCTMSSSTCALYGLLQA